MAKIGGSHAARVAERASLWRAILCVSDATSSKLTDGLLDLPTKPVRDFSPMGAVPQSAEDIEFGVGDFRVGCGAGVYQRVEDGEAEALIELGYLVGSAFTLWQGDGAERKGRFVVNFSIKRKFWERGSVKMERMDEFAPA